MTREPTRRRILRSTGISTVGFSLISSQGVAAQQDNPNPAKKRNRKENGLKVINNSKKEQKIEIYIEDQIKEINLEKGRENASEGKNNTFEGDIQTSRGEKFDIKISKDGQKTTTAAHITSEGVIESELISIYVDEDGKLDAVTGVV
jgi:hypothetical protein